MNTDILMVGVGLVGFLVTIATAWQGKFRAAAGLGLLTGALLVACMFVFRPSANAPAADAVAISTMIGSA